MLVVTFWAILLVTVVDARVLSRIESTDADRSVSSGSDEAEIFVSHNNEGKAVVSKRYLDPPPGKNVYMVKRVNPKPEPVTESLVAVTSKSWTKILNKLSGAHAVDSSEEAVQIGPVFKGRTRENTERHLVNVEDEIQNPSDPMVIAQKWFPMLLRRAVENMRKNISKHEMDHLVEELSFGHWNTEMNNKSDKAVINTMFENIYQGGINSETEFSSASEISPKYKRSYYQGHDSRPGASDSPWIVNIFNNSHIGNLMLKPAYNGSEGNSKNCSRHPSMGNIPQFLGLLLGLPNCSIPCVQPPGPFSSDLLNNYGTVHPRTSTTQECTTTTTTPCPTTTTPSPTTTTPRPSTTTPYPTTTTPCSTTTTPYPTTTTPCSTTTTTTESCTTTTSEPVTTTTTTSKPPVIFPPFHPPSYYHPMAHQGIPESRVRLNEWPWFGPSRPEYYSREPYIIPRRKYEEKVIYDRPYESSGDDCDFSNEGDSGHHHVKREQHKSVRPMKYKSKQPKTTTAKAPRRQSVSQSEEAVRLIIDLPSAFKSQEVRDDTHLRNTLAKIGLSLDTDRPPVANPARSLGKSRYKTLSPVRSQQTQNKTKTREKDEISHKKRGKSSSSTTVSI